MNRVKATASVAFASRDQAPGTGTPQYFTVGVPGSQPATVLPGYFVNMTMDELMSIVTAAGLTPDDANWNQVWQGLLRSITFQDTGGANHLIIALPAGLTFPAGAVGLGTTFQVRALNSNTGAVDFAPFGLTAAPVIRLDTNFPLSRGDILAGGIYTLTYDGGGSWQCRTLNPSTIIQAAALYKPTVVVKNTPGAWSWVVPAGVQRARFRLWGGGGGGGGVTDPGGGSGGGGGCYGAVSLAIIAGETITGSVGAAGAAGTPGNAGAGLYTSLDYGGLTYRAGGGFGGLGANNNAPNSVSGGDTTGTTGAFDESHVGQPSSGGIAGFKAGPAILYYGGGGGLAQLGGFGGQAGTGAPNNGQPPGGGGGGAASSGGGNVNGGVGAVGQVEISY